MGNGKRRKRGGGQERVAHCNICPPAGGVLNLNKTERNSVLIPAPCELFKGSCQKDEFVTVSVSTAAAAVIMAEDPTPGRAGTKCCCLGGDCSSRSCGQASSRGAQACSVSPGALAETRGVRNVPRCRDANHLDLGLAGLAFYECVLWPHSHDVSEQCGGTHKKQGGHRLTRVPVAFDGGHLLTQEAHRPCLGHSPSVPSHIVPTGVHIHTSVHAHTC